jgi:hypothetical protein
VIWRLRGTVTGMCLHMCMYLYNVCVYIYIYIHTHTHTHTHMTGGTDAGIMRLMGEGKAMYAPEVPLIGFASWSVLHQKEVCT